MKTNGKSRDVAEGVGFEPTIRLRVCRFSRPVYSTTLAPLLGKKYLSSQSLIRKNKIRIRYAVFYFSGNC